MKITLVYPNLGRHEDRGFRDRAAMEPLGLGVLAGLTPPDVEVVLHDDRVEDIPFDAPTDLVAITAQVFTARRAYEISREYRRRGKKVILGGVHPTLLPEEAAAHADSVLVGDAEGAWPEVVEDLRAAELKPRYDGTPGVAQEGGVLPRWDLFRGKGYLPINLVQYGRGCHFACDFCAVSAYFRRRHHYRPVAEVVAEVQARKNRLFFFVDDNIISDHQAAKDLFRALIPLKVRWVSQASLDMLEDPELMELMMESGCLGHVVGFESVDPGSLQGMGKYQNLRTGLDRYAGAVEELRSYGLQTWAAFTLGHDHDTVDSLRETLAFAKRSRFAFAAFNILMPYPGTPLYRRLQREDRLLFSGRWWRHPDYRFNHAAFRPAHMTADELTRIGLESRRSFNSVGSILRRAVDPKTNLKTLRKLVTYSTYGPLFRREALKKQDLRLGEH
ncbi:MAG: B12-binding domain-containing radical SAM protein [Longimicrobiales bacterium]